MRWGSTSTAAIYADPFCGDSFSSSSPFRRRLRLTGPSYAQFPPTPERWCLHSPDWLCPFCYQLGPLLFLGSLRQRAYRTRSPSSSTGSPLVLLSWEIHSGPFLHLQPADVPKTHGGAGYAGSASDDSVEPVVGGTTSSRSWTRTSRCPWW